MTARERRSSFKLRGVTVGSLWRRACVRLEVLALRGTPCEIVAVAAEGTVRWLTDRIVDVVAEGPEEFARLESGERIRLDHLLVVDGQPRSGARPC